MGSFLPTLESDSHRVIHSRGLRELRKQKLSICLLTSEKRCPRETLSPRPVTCHRSESKNDLGQDDTGHLPPSSVQLTECMFGFVLTNKAFKTQSLKH